MAHLCEPRVGLHALFCQVFVALGLVIPAPPSMYDLAFVPACSREVDSISKKLFQPSTGLKN